MNTSYKTEAKFFYFQHTISQCKHYYSKERNGAWKWVPGPKQEQTHTAQTLNRGPLYLTSGVSGGMMQALKGSDNSAFLTYVQPTLFWSGISGCLWFSLADVSHSWQPQLPLHLQLYSHNTAHWHLKGSLQSDFAALCLHCSNQDSSPFCCSFSFEIGIEGFMTTLTFCISTKLLSWGWCQSLLPTWTIVVASVPR